MNIMNEEFPIKSDFQHFCLSRDFFGMSLQIFFPAERESERHPAAASAADGADDVDEGQDGAGADGRPVRDPGQEDPAAPG